jgi:hypothetical protein
MKTNNFFIVEYLVGGSSNWVVKRLTTKFENWETANEEVKDIRLMGYAAMVVNPSIGGFEYFDSPYFENNSREKYWEECQNKFN